MNKFSFRTKWLDDKEKFQVTLLCNGKLCETQEFEWQGDMFEYIGDMMADLQIAGEDWTFSY